MRPISQFRFVQTVVMVPPALSQDVKYLAVYNMDDGRLAVLAQGKDKYTLKKWAGILRVRTAAMVSAVDDMTAALEFARAQAGFEEHGKFTYCKSGSSKPPSSAVPARQQAPVTKTQEVWTGKPSPAAQKPVPDEYDTPGYIIARQVCQKRLRYLEEAERLSNMIMSDVNDEEFLDVDIDRVPQSKPRISLQECCERGRHIARQVAGFLHIVGLCSATLTCSLSCPQTALNHLQRLEHEGQLTHRCIIPPALREEYDAIKQKRAQA